MRSAFINTLHKLAEEDEKIFLLNGDLGFSVLEGFTKSFSKRSLNMGVSEANMIGVASGLALSGKTVFVYSIIPFVTSRVFEQIRDDVALQKANVKIVGVGSGFTYGQLGPTHHSIEDIGIMRTLPNMTIICPGDPYETEEATKAIAALSGPVYLRIGKKGEPTVHKKSLPFKVGRAITVKKGTDCAIVATGNMLPVGLAVSEILDREKIKARLVSMHTIKPLDVNSIKRAALETGAVFTLEEHNIIGGLGSAVAEVLPYSRLSPIFVRFGIQDKFTHIAGTQDFLRSYHKISAKNIAFKIIKSLRGK